jgi:hypothetical protein
LLAARANPLDGFLNCRSRLASLLRLLPDLVILTACDPSAVPLAASTALLSCHDLHLRVVDGQPLAEGGVPGRCHRRAAALTADLGGPGPTPTQAVAACESDLGWRILSLWGPNHARPFTALRSAHRLSAPLRHERKPTNLPAKPGTSACSVTRDRPSRRPLWVTGSMPVIGVSKYGASAATHQTVALDIVRRPKTTPVHELER